VDEERAGSSEAKQERIHLTAKKFELSPASVTVRKGEPVTIELTSADRVRGFRLPDFDVRIEVKPGVRTGVSFVPHKAGTSHFIATSSVVTVTKK
jgi:cytochrome c oxidase subunit 2